MDKPTSLDQTGTICYIRLQDLQTSLHDTPETLAPKIQHLKDLIDKAETQLWHAECQHNLLTNKPLFNLGQIVHISHESAAVGHHIGKIVRIDPSPDSFRYTLTIHKIYWRTPQVGVPDESRYRSVQRFESDIWTDPEENLTDRDLIPKKYRVETPARSADRPSKEAKRTPEEEEFLRKMRNEL